MLRVAIDCVFFDPIKKKSWICFPHQPMYGVGPVYLLNELIICHFRLGKSVLICKNNVSGAYSRNNLQWPQMFYVSSLVNATSIQGDTMGLSYYFKWLFPFKVGKSPTSICLFLMCGMDFRNWQPHSMVNPEICENSIISFIDSL